MKKERVKKYLAVFGLIITFIVMCLLDPALLFLWGMSCASPQSSMLTNPFTFIIILIMIGFGYLIQKFANIIYK